MKRQIKKILIFILNPILIRMGYEKQDYSSNGNKNSLLQTLFTNIKIMGFIPNHIIDVGANHGTWTREVLKYFPDSYYTLIEPQNWLKPSFQDLLDSNERIKYFDVGAGKKEGSFKFTIVDRDDSCSYRFSEEDAIKMGYKQLEIPVVTVNNLVSKNNLEIPDIIKIDAEGLDIEVLEGASDFFGKTEIFIVEAGVFMKEFDNSFIKMINYMDEMGYNLFEITDMNRPFSPKVLWLVELVFVKKDGVIDSYKIGN